MYRTSEQRCNKSLKCLHIHQALEVLGADECLRQGQELQVKNLRLGRQTDKLYKQGLLKTVWNWSTEASENFPTAVAAAAAAIQQQQQQQQILFSERICWRVTLEKFVT